jgi:hypothetical protein
MIASNCREHFPNSPSLLGRHDEKIEIQTSLKKKKCGSCQQELF